VGALASTSIDGGGGEEQSVTEGPDHEILIIGAGFSGIGAAIALDRAAAAAHARSGAHAVVAATGHAAVRAGDLVDLDGLPRDSGTYRVLRARHELDLGGFRTSLELEAAA
jgi:hypothetical protein